MVQEWPIQREGKMVQEQPIQREGKWYRNGLFKEKVNGTGMAYSKRR